MTNSEARQILIDYNSWRRGDEERLDDLIAIGKAIDAAIVALGEPDDLTLVYMKGFSDGKRSKSSIAQAIRDAAVNGDIPSNLQLEIAFCFCSLCGLEKFHFKDQLFYGTTKEKYHARTFLLIVAEALES